MNITWLRQRIRAFDHSVSGSVYRWPRRCASVLLAFTATGEPIVTIGIGALFAVLGALTQQIQLFGGGVSVVLTLLMTSLLKQFFRRARPAKKLADALWLDTYSFPSGHASGSVAAYGLVAIFFSANGLLFPAIVVALFPIIIGFSRIYIRVHYPSDVVGGWLLGLAGLFLVLLSVSLW